MNTEIDISIEDIQAASQACRPVRPHGPYQIAIGNDSLQYVHAVIDDPVPTGRQILLAGGFRPAEEHSVFQMLKGGQLEEIRLDESTDIRVAGVERFLVFKSDRSFRFELDGQVLEWGGVRISGLTLKRLADVDPVSHDIWVEVRGSEDCLIDDADLFDLSKPGVERFYTGQVKFQIIVNGRPKEVSQRELPFWGIVKLAYPEATVNETTIYTITYKRGPGINPEGSLVDGQSVKLKNGMNFNVIFTDKS